MISEFLPAKTTTLIEFDCVMSFSNMQLSRITNMNDNIIIKGFGLRTGPICVTCAKQPIKIVFREEIRIDSSSLWNIFCS